jgi:hypothetical protein
MPSADQVPIKLPHSIMRCAISFTATAQVRRDSYIVHPCQGRRRRGVGMCLAISTPAVAFCGTENISAPNLSYAAQYLACGLPCERFTSALADNPCITRGRYGRYTFTVTDFHRLPFAGLPAHPSTHEAACYEYSKVTTTKMLQTITTTPATSRKSNRRLLAFLDTSSVSEQGDDNAYMGLTSLGKLDPMGSG